MSDWSQIHALADNELFGAEKAEAENRLSTCAKSRAEFETVQALKAVLQSKCEAMECEATWAKCQDRLKQIDRTKRVERMVGRYAWAMCAMFFVAIVSAGMLNRVSPRGVAAGEVARMSAGFAPISAPEPNSAREERRKWVDGIFGKPMPVRTEGLALVGGAKGLVNGVETLRIDLQDRRGPLSLFVIPSAAIKEMQPDASGFALVDVQPNQGISWREGEVTFMMLGNRTRDELRSVADALRKQP